MFTKSDVYIPIQVVQAGETRNLVRYKSKTVLNQVTHILTNTWQTSFCVNTHIYWSVAINGQNILLEILLLNSFLKIQVYTDWLENNSTTTSIWSHNRNRQLKEKEKKEAVYPNHLPSLKRSQQLWKTRKTNSYMCNTNTCTFTRSLPGHIHWRVQMYF